MWNDQGLTISIGEIHGRATVWDKSRRKLGSFAGVQTARGFIEFIAVECLDRDIGSMSLDEIEPIRNQYLLHTQPHEVGKDFSGEE